MKPRGRKVDPLQKKAQRQKQIAIGGAVVLLLLGAYEVPKLLKHGKSASPSTTSTTTTPGVTPVATTPTPVSATLPGGEVPLPNESGPTASTGQLVSFSLLKSKDPFKQQLVDKPSSGPPPSTTPPATTTGSTPPATTPPVETTPVETTPVETTPTETTPTETSPTETSPTETTPTETSPTETTPQTSTGPATTIVPPQPTSAPKPISAKIQVNGVAEDVTIGDAFPKAQPLFRLASIKDGVARIGIAGGTLQGKSQTVPLVQGKSLTLMNTADGMRYVLKLVSVAYVAGS